MPPVINHKNVSINPGDKTLQAINVLIAAFEYKQKS